MSEKVLSAGYPYTKNEKDLLKQAIIQGYVMTEKNLENQHFDISFSGSTCINIIIRGHYMLCANVGDSRAIVCSKY